MALRGVKVIEIAGLAPAPFCGLILSDFGAEVLRIERPNQPPFDPLLRGKRAVAMDLKRDECKDLFRKMCTSADVLIEPFRPGVMERLELGPTQLSTLNAKLIYARLSGFGQTGPLALRAGHDINYLALSGILNSLGPSNGPPRPPINILGDFAGGGLTCAMGICMALIERFRSGMGQVVDCSITEGTAYTSSWIWATRQSPIASMLWPSAAATGGRGPAARGKNTLDGGAHFYQVYPTKDGKFMSVGSIEPQFYARLLQGLGIGGDEADKYGQFDVDRWPEYISDFSARFAQRTQQEWIQTFAELDACVEPVLSEEEAARHPQNVARGAFLADGTPRPAPLLSRTPAEPRVAAANGQRPHNGTHTREVLRELGLADVDIQKMASDGAIELPEEEDNGGNSSKL